MKRAPAGSVLLLVFLASCSFGGGEPRGFVTDSLEGSVQVKAEGAASFVALKAGAIVEPGATIRVPSGGSAILKRGPGSFLRLRPYEEASGCDVGSLAEQTACLADAMPALPAEATFTSIERVRVASGDVLIRSLPSAPITVESNGVDATTKEGTFRFDRRLSLRVAVYEGTATLSAAGVVLELPSLREGVVAGRDLPRQPSLLRYLASDPWDRELLKDVIDLDGELIAQRRGYEGKFGKRTPSAAVDREIEALEGLAGDADVSFVRPSVQTYRKGDVLIGIVFALLLQEQGKGTAGDLYGAALSSAADGASWGFLARDRGLAPDDLLSGVVRAIGLRTGEVDQGTVLIPEPAPTPGVRESGRPTPKPTSTKTSKPKPSPSPSKTTTPKPSPSPSPTPTQTCSQIGPICVGGLTGGLG